MVKLLKCQLINFVLKTINEQIYDTAQFCLQTEDLIHMIVFAA